MACRPTCIMIFRNWFCVCLICVIQSIYWQSEIWDTIKWCMFSWLTVESTIMIVAPVYNSMPSRRSSVDGNARKCNPTDGQQSIQALERRGNVLPRQLLFRFTDRPKIKGRTYLGPASLSILFWQRLSGRILEITTSLAFQWCFWSLEITITMININVFNKKKVHRCKLPGHIKETLSFVTVKFVWCSSTRLQFRLNPVEQVTCYEYEGQYRQIII